MQGFISLRLLDYFLLAYYFIAMHFGIANLALAALSLCELKVKLKKACALDYKCSSRRYVLQ